MIFFDSKEKPDLKDLDKIEELQGNLSSQTQEDKLMRSVLESDKKTIDYGKIILDSINHGIHSFNPEMLFEQIVKDYALAEKIYGTSFLREITGEDPSSIKRNLKIPEYQRHLKSKIKSKIEELKFEDYLDKQNNPTHKAISLASLYLYTSELDNLEAKGLIGEKPSKKFSYYGARFDTKDYKKGDRYKDLDLEKTVKQAIRKKHKKIQKEDLKVFKREAKGKIEIVYALDASGSMTGKKIEQCKKAAVALAYKAINEKDKVGLIVFGEKIETVINPTSEFMSLIYEITKIKAKKQTNIADSLKKSLEIFSSAHDSTKHLILITDGLPTVGENPQEETINAVSQISSSGITISVVGIALDKKGLELSQKIANIGNGRLYSIRTLENLDYIVLQDYYSLQ